MTTKSKYEAATQEKLRLRDGDYVVADVADALIVYVADGFDVVDMFIRTMGSETEYDIYVMSNKHLKHLGCSALWRQLDNTRTKKQK